MKHNIINTKLFLFFNIIVIKAKLMGAIDLCTLIAQIKKMIGRKTKRLFMLIIMVNSLKNSKI